MGLQDPLPNRLNSKVTPDPVVPSEAIAGLTNTKSYEGRPVIVASTSIYLSGAISGLTGYDEVNFNKLVSLVRFQMRSAIVSPGSDIGDAVALVAAYGNSYLRDLQAEQKLELAKTFLDGVEVAKNEGRYFCRNPVFLIKSYGDIRPAAKAFLDFFKNHAFELKDPLEYLTRSGQLIAGKENKFFENVLVAADIQSKLTHPADN